MTQRKQLVELLDGLELPPIDTDGEMYLEKSDAEYIADYLLKNGVIVPPCKVGDTVYIIPSKTNYDLNKLFNKEEANRVYKQTVSEIRKSDEMLMIFTRVKEQCADVLTEKSFGKRWFLTREAAEQALKERET